MKKLLDMENWNRKEQFNFFSKFSEPFFGVTVKVECTNAYAKAKERNVSFFLYYLYRALKAANEIDHFKYRIIDNRVYEYETVNASPTINRPDGTFGFAYMDYIENEEEVYNDTGRATYSLIPNYTGEVLGPNTLSEYLYRPYYFSSPREIRLGAAIEF